MSDHVEEQRRKLRGEYNAALEQYKPYLSTTPLDPATETPASPPGAQAAYENLRAKEAELKAFEQLHPVKRLP